ncbi:MAG: hypothetical protein ACOX1J_07205 [Dethiobacteria bacterium]
MGGFIYYRINDKKIMGRSGYPLLPGISSEKMIQTEVIPVHGGVLEDYGALYLEDKDMSRCYETNNYALKIDNGQVVGVEILPKVEDIGYDYVDPEKLAMAEAIIAHELEIQTLKAEIAALKGEE